ncbi:zinc-binding dehydrogenase [Kribbella sp. NPDC026611]|uniref:zinc-binding dehydrogenase n=1 Tax=Kribbella sp. NPDC026611 TaxID=3154911 RepID=UPI0034030DBC
MRCSASEEVLDYTRDDFADAAPYDVILDVAGNATLRKLRHATTPKGRIVIVGGETDGRWLGGTDRQLRAMLLAPFIGQSLKVYINSEKHEDLSALADLAAAGKFTPPVDRVFPLDQTAAAVRYLKDCLVRGKTVVSITG